MIMIVNIPVNFIEDIIIYMYIYIYMYNYNYIYIILLIKLTPIDSAKKSF